MANPPIPPGTGFTVTDYFLSRFPDFTTVWPEQNVAILCVAGMALYWPQLFRTISPLPQIDETQLTERQKNLVALRAAVTALPAYLQRIAGKVKEAQAGPALAKFEDRIKYYLATEELWKNELLQIEGREGVTNVNPYIPAFLQKVQDDSCLGTFMVDVIPRDVYVIGSI